MGKIGLYCGFCSVRPRQLEAQSERVRFGDKPQSISYSHDYPTFYICRNGTETNFKAMSNLELFIRWHDFLSQKGIPDDIVFLIQRTSKAIISKLF